MKKGFTLIELLAVIVILALIALVTIPLIGNVIEKSKKEAFKDSVLSAFNAVEHYILKNNVNLNENGINVKDLSLKNNNFISGRIIKNTNGKLVAEFLSDGKYCATGLMTNLKINKGECEITAPIIEVTVNEKEASINITDEYGIVGYIITETEEEPTNWNEVKELTSIVETITADHAGTYYIYTKNKYGKISKKEYLINSSAFCAYQPGDVVGTFEYKRNVEEFNVPCSGVYKLEVWGGEGVSGGAGGYSSGELVLSKNSKIYVVVGGGGWHGWSADSSIGYNGPQSGGYNGGGNGGSNTSGDPQQTPGFGGGGATHIATTNRGELLNYSDYRGEILIVAGGGAGWTTNVGKGGVGGGTAGGGGSFGKGSNGNADSGRPSGGGGGGYIGGATYGVGTLSSGGTGYVDGLVNSMMENGVNSGNGKATITYIAS